MREVKADCLRLRGTPAGEARTTPGHRLPARYVIHTVGPVWRGGGAGEEALLARCHRSCLELAAQHRVGTVAFPAISTGAFGFPLERAAQVAVSATREALQGLPGIRQVIFVCFDEESFGAYYREAVYGDGPR